MKDKFSRKRKKYAIALLAATTATVATSFTLSAPWVMASKNESGGGANPNLPPVFNPPVYNELDFDPDNGKIKAYYYHVQAGENVTVTPNTFTTEDYDGTEVTFNNFIVKANDTLVEDSDDIVIDKDTSENTIKEKDDKNRDKNGVTRKYKLTLSKALKDKIDKAAAGGGGGAPSKLEDGTNTTVSGDGTEGNKYRVNIKSDVTGITSVAGNATNGLTLKDGSDGTTGNTEVAITKAGVTFKSTPTTGAGTTVTITSSGITVGGGTITNLADGTIGATSTDAVTGKQLFTTNTKVTNLENNKLDKAKERHIKPTTYNVTNGTVTLDYEDGEGNATTEKAIINGVAAKSDVWTLGIQNTGDTTATAITPSTDGKVALKAGENVTLESNAGTVTISAKNKITSVTSGNQDTLTVNTSNGVVTINPVLAGSISNTGDANKLVTAGVVNTAIAPLANKNLSNIDEVGKKVITGLGTEVIQGDGVTVVKEEDTATGKKKYTISAVKANFANGTNTRVSGDGTATSPYTFNLNSTLTGISSVAGDTGLSLMGAGTTVTINGNGVNVGGAKVTNLADATLSDTSTEAVTGKQLHATNEKVEGKLDKAAERHIKSTTYNVENGKVTLKYVDGDNQDADGEAIINGVAAKSDLWKLSVNGGDVTPTNGTVNLTAGDNIDIQNKNGAVTISAKDVVKHVTSTNPNVLTVTNQGGNITITPVLATSINDGTKLATANLVNTAVTPLANKTLDNITIEGKKVITGLGTKVVQGTGVTVSSTQDAEGVTTYTISANATTTPVQKFKAGMNTTLTGDGSTGNEYSFDVKPDLTSISSVSGGTNGLTLKSGDGTNGKTELSLTNGSATFTSTPAGGGSGKVVTISSAGIDAGHTKITNLTDPDNDGDAATKKYVDDNTWKLGIQKVDGTSSTTVTPTGTTSKQITFKEGENITLTEVGGTITVAAKHQVEAVEKAADDANDTNIVTVTPKAGSTQGSANATYMVGVSKNKVADIAREAIAIEKGDGSHNVTVDSKTENGKTTYKISVAEPQFESGTNTTLVGTGSSTDKYKFNLNPDLRSINSIAGDTSLTLTGGNTSLKINAAGVTVNGKVTGLTDGNVADNSTDAVTGKQLFDTNTRVTTLENNKLDKTAERHINPTEYRINNSGDVELTYVDGNGTAVTGTKATIKDVAKQSDLWRLTVNGNEVAPTGGKVSLTAGDNIDIKSEAGKVTISAKDVVKSVASTNTNALTVTNDKGNVSITPVVANDLVTVGNENKLVTAGVVHTAITNATNPLTKNDLSNITDAGKKVITGLGTKVAAGTGIDVQESEDTATGQKTYTVSTTATAPKFENGTNTTVSGDGTEANKYTFNVSPTLTNITSVTGNTTSGLTLSSGGDTTTGKTELALVNGGATFTSTSAGGTVKTVTISTTGINTGDTKITNLADGAISNTSKDAVNGSQLFNERVTSPVIFVDKDGKQVFKTADGKFVNKDGTEITDADDLAKIHTKVNATNPMALDNVASTIEDTTVPNAADPQNPTFKEKLTAAAGNDATKHAVVNVEDLHKATTSASDSTVAKGLDFYGDDTTTTGKVHRDLGTALKIQGADTYTRKATDTTGTTNISVTKNASGDGLNVAMANTLRGITSITNGDGATDVASTTMNITGDGVEITNTQPAANGNKASKTTVTIGKDGINAGGTKITNVAEGAINETSTDVVIGKQLHATNTDVANLKLTKLDKTDDVHVQAGEYAVNDKTGTVELTLAKGENDTDTGKKVKISGIVTHAVLSNTMDAYELNIEGDENTTNKNSLKKGVAVHGSSNFTPDQATKNAGINIQAKATDKGFDVKLADTLTNMKGITFAPTTQGGASVSLTATGLDNGGNRITNVAAGVNDTDAVNVSQLKNLAHATVNVDSRINRLGAQSAAMAGLRHLQYDPMEPTTVMAGVGTYKGQTALALGIAHYKNESLLFHAGASIGSNHDELMANAGVSWKFGSRSGEVAVKDTFRQGPISSSYALQDKVAALEAQNQMQKEEINELKAQLAEVLQYIKKAN